MAKKPAARLPIEMRSLTAGQTIHFLIINLLVAATSIEEVFKGRHHAHADGLVMLRNVPPPALFVRRLNDQRGTAILARSAVGTLPVGPDRPLVKYRVPMAAA